MKRHEKKLLKILKMIQKIITEITEEALQGINDEIDEEIDEDMKGEVESVILEMVDKIALALEEQVITENTEEQEQVRNNEWTCKYCSKVLKAKDTRLGFRTCLFIRLLITKINKNVI